MFPNSWVRINSCLILHHHHSSYYKRKRRWRVWKRKSNNRGKGEQRERERERSEEEWRVVWSSTRRMRGLVCWGIRAMCTLGRQSHSALQTSTPPWSCVPPKTSSSNPTPPTISSTSNPITNWYVKIFYFLFDKESEIGLQMLSAVNRANDP